MQQTTESRQKVDNVTLESVAGSLTNAWPQGNRDAPTSFSESVMGNDSLSPSPTPTPSSGSVGPNSSNNSQSPSTSVGPNSGKERVNARKQAKANCKRKKRKKSPVRRREYKGV
jgi:hypothetical protein